jgi:two-component system chemotaxis sensor kinase CheA
VLIAVLHADGKRFGLVIDRVLSTEEIVVKPLGSQLKALGTYSGATILGDGRVALILDVQALARRVLNTDGVDQADGDESDASAAVTEHLRMLVAGIGGERRVAIPLSSVTRLENLNKSVVERIGNREVIQYRGGILPVVRLNNYLGSFSERDSDELVVVVYSVGDRSAAIVVEEIVDIIDEETEFHTDVADHGVLGSTLVRDRIVEVLDVRAAILSADPSFYTASDLLDAELQETM